jgi:hypothetical protein
MNSLSVFVAISILASRLHEITAGLGHWHETNMSNWLAHGIAIAAESKQLTLHLAGNNVLSSKRMILCRFDTQGCNVEGITRTPEAPENHTKTEDRALYTPRLHFRLFPPPHSLYPYPTPQSTLLATCLHHQ